MKKAALILLILSVIMTSCAEVYRYTNYDFYAMSTFVNVMSENRPDGKLAEKSVRSYDKMLSRTNGESEIYSLNRDGQGEVSDECLYVIERALQISRDTDYAFNVCMGNLTELWNITSGDEYVPSIDEITKALKGATADNVVTDENTVVLGEEIKIDLGGIAKGYILQKTMEKLKDGNNNKNICLNFGGNVAVSGSSSYSRQNGKIGWQVGIVNPFDKNSTVGTLMLEEGYVSVSGGYERYFQKDGRIYHHIFDSRTGYPAQSDLACVCIVSGDGLEADALSTALFVMGKSGAIDFYKSGRYDFEAILITGDGEIYISGGLHDKFTLDESIRVDGKEMTIIKI